MLKNQDVFIDENRKEFDSTLSEFENNIRKKFNEIISAEKSFYFSVGLFCGMFLSMPFWMTAGCLIMRHFFK